MRLKVISTGSSANCYLLEAGAEVLILDAGVSVKKVLPYIKDFRSIVGCLVTHEHKDHSRGAKELAMRGIDVFSSSGTLEAIGLMDYEACAIKPLEAVKTGKFTIMAFETQHDAAQPFGFLVRYDETGENLIYATDTYYLRYTFPNINYWIVECNYTDENLSRALEKGELNLSLRNRLLQSHMSLRRLKQALAANDLSEARKIVLVHLSDSRSDEQRMVREIEEMTGIETVAALNGMDIQLDMIPF